jgi:hypothetical protein
MLLFPTVIFTKERLGYILGDTHLVTLFLIEKKEMYDVRNVIKQIRFLPRFHLPSEIRKFLYPYENSCKKYLPNLKDKYQINFRTNIL